MKTKTKQKMTYRSTKSKTFAVRSKNVHVNARVERTKGTLSQIKKSHKNVHTALALFKRQKVSFLSR